MGGLGGYWQHKALILLAFLPSAVPQANASRALPLARARNRSQAPRSRPGGVPGAGVPGALAWALPCLGAILAASGAPWAALARFQGGPCYRTPAPLRRSTARRLRVSGRPGRQLWDKKRGKGRLGTRKAAPLLGFRFQFDSLPVRFGL